MAEKRTGWSGNEASRDERQHEELPGDWLTNPAYWDTCDRHMTTFPMWDICPKCKAESETER